MPKKRILPSKNSCQHFFRNNNDTILEEFSYLIDGKSHITKSYFCKTC